MIMDDRGCERGKATNLAWAERVRELVEHHRVNEVQGPWITV